MKCQEFSQPCPKLTEEQQERIFLASGSTHPQLATATAEFMGVELGEVERRQFPDGERYVRYGDSVRGKNVFILQTGASRPGFSINDGLQETLLMVDAARRGSADHTTVVAPHMPYSRQDRKTRGREAISVAVVIRQLAALETGRIICMDLHSQQTQAIFNGPFDHLTAEPLLSETLAKRIADDGNKDKFVVVAPDSGRAKTADWYAEELDIDVVYMPKSRDRADSSKIKRPNKIGEVAGRTCLLIDDMIDTAGTLVSAAETLKNSQADSVIAAATHGLFSDPALERLQSSPIDELIVTDTVPTDRAEEVLGNRLRVISVAPIIGRALVEVAMQGSVSKLFQGRNNL